VDNEKFQELVVQQLQKLSEGQSRIESRMDKLESKVDKLESKVDKLELRMENEVIDKIRILFDAREAQNQRLDRIEDSSKA
jgi:outer membrane murein-binding lipoprotein Lpp